MQGSNKITDQHNRAIMFVYCVSSLKLLNGLLTFDTGESTVKVVTQI